jgi:hypothetical protein
MMMNAIDTPAVEENQTQALGQHSSQIDLEDDEELVNEILENLNKARVHYANWRKDAREAYEFYAGNQWSDDDKAYMENQQRVPVTFNRIARVINAVAGLELQNRQEVRFIARRVGPVMQNPQLSTGGYADVLTQASKWVRDQCDAEDEESESFQDALICGMGWTDTRMDYEDDPEGKCIIERRDPLDMLSDHEARKRNLVDARWIAEVKQISKRQFKQMFGDRDITPGLFWNDAEVTPHDAQDAWKYENDQSDKLSKPNTITVIRYQYYDKENYYQVATNEGNVIELSANKFAKLESTIKAWGLQYVSRTKKKYKQIFLCGRTILEKMDINCDDFTFHCITGLRNRNENTWFGLVQLMMDPQRWANKWLSQIQHIVNSGAKNGLIVEQGAINNPRKFEEDYAKPGTVSTVAPGAISGGRIMPKQPPQYPDGVDRLLNYAISAINDVPGVNLELIGLAERDQPIGLEETRKQAGITMLANFFSALRYYRKVQGRLLAHFIKEYIADGRLIRIVGEEGAQYIPLVKDDLAFKYDIVVDDAPTSPNMKERVFSILSMFMPVLMQAGIPIPPDILDYAPLPEGLVQKWKQMIMQAGSNPLEEQLKQLEMMQRYLDTQKTASEVTLNQAKAQQASAISQDESAQAMQKLGIAQQESQMKQEQMMLENQRKDLEMFLNQRRKMIEAQMNARIKAQQMSSKRPQK